MTQVQLNQDIEAILNSANATFQSQEADMGQGNLGHWPEVGENKTHRMALEGLRIERSEWTYRDNKTKMLHKIDAVVFQPHYSWKDQVGGKDVWRKCQGKAHYLVPDSTLGQLPDEKGNNKKWMAENAFARVKGHLCGIFNCTDSELGDNIFVAITKAAQKIASLKDNGSVLTVDVKTTYEYPAVEMDPDTGKPKEGQRKDPYFNDYITASIG